jgi:hypothetical protein
MKFVYQKSSSGWFGFSKAWSFIIVFLTLLAASHALGSEVLFVAGGTALSKGDQALKTRLETSGFTVTVKRDSTVQAQDADGKSLVLISESIIPGNVGKVFSGVKVPLICAEASLFDDLGMTGKKQSIDYGYTVNDSQMNIVDASHVVVSLSGTVTATSRGSKMAWGVPGGNAIRVASLTDSPGKFTFFAYKEGVQMPTLVAPSRRVALFVTSDAAANLTVDGWELFDSAVDWAVGLDFFPHCPHWTHTLTFVNNCKETVHIIETPGCYPGKINDPPFNGGKCWPQMAGGGFQLQPGKGNQVKVPILSCWSGNYGVSCSTCSTHIQTLVEFTFDSGLNSKGEKLSGLLDTYDVSLVDGFTKTFHIAPDLNVPSGGGNCATAGCQKLPACPKKLVDGDACLSPCQLIGKQYDGSAVCSDNADCLSGDCDQDSNRCKAPSDTTEYLKYCCVCSKTKPCACEDLTGHLVPDCCQGMFGCSPFSPPGKTNLGSSCCPFYNKPDEDCSATSPDRAWDPWALDYIKAIRTDCPGEYSWQYDDKHGTFDCQGKGGAMNYTITVCP